MIRQQISSKNSPSQHRLSTTQIEEFVFIDDNYSMRGIKGVKPIGGVAQKAFSVIGLKISTVYLIHAH